MRFVNEEHIEDNEVNIGVMDPQHDHLASRCWHKVFGVFLFTLSLNGTPKIIDFTTFLLDEVEPLMPHQIILSTHKFRQPLEDIFIFVFRLSSPDKTTGLEICLNAVNNIFLDKQPPAVS